jgi:hypothetical protein
MGIKLLENQLQDPTAITDVAALTDLATDLRSSCTIAVEILNDLLLYEKIDAGLMKLETTEQLVWPFAVEVFRIFRFQVGNVGLLPQHSLVFSICFYCIYVV